MGHLILSLSMFQRTTRSYYHTTIQHTLRKVCGVNIVVDFTSVQNVSSDQRIQLFLWSGSYLVSSEAVVCFLVTCFCLTPVIKALLTECHINNCKVPPLSLQIKSGSVTFDLLLNCWPKTLPLLLSLAGKPQEKYKTNSSNSSGLPRAGIVSGLMWRKKERRMNFCSVLFLHKL